MSLEIIEVTDSGSKDFPRLEEGTYPARIVRIIELGTQAKTNWQTGEQECYEDGTPIFQKKVWVDFELPTETIDIGGEAKPRWQGKEYTLSFHPKAALMAVVNSIGEKVTNLSQIVDKPLMIQIGSTSGGKAKVAGVSKIMKGLVVDPLVNTPIIFDIDDPDMDVLEKIPNFLKEKILPNLPAGDKINEDIPF